MLNNKKEILLGDNPFFGNIKTINGKTEFQNTKNVEDFVSASLGFENGINCSFEASWNVDNYRLPETTIEVNGTKGKLKVNENFLKISYFNENEKDSILYKQNLYTGVEIDIAGPEYTQEDLDFIDSINIVRERYGKKVENAYFSKSSSSNLRNVCDSVINLSKIITKLEIEKGSVLSKDHTEH